MSVMPGADSFTHDGGDIGVVLSHGYPSTPASMRPWADRLVREGYSVRVPLLPGMGTRWQDLNKTRWPDWYGAIEDAYTELAGRCRLVFAMGLSMGGLLVTKLAEDHPELAGLVVANPIYKHDNPALPLLPLLRWIVPVFPGIAGDIKKPGVREQAYGVNPLQAMYSQAKLWRIVEEDLGKVQQPALLAYSVEDHVVPAISWQAFLAGVSSTDVTVLALENSYHVATLDYDAELLFDASVDFVKRVSGTSSAD